MSPPTVATGTGMVNASALDGAVASIVARINALVAAINRWTDATNQIADKHIRLRMLNDRVTQDIKDAIEAIATIRKDIGSTNVDPGQQRTNNLPLPAHYFRFFTGPGPSKSDRTDFILGSNSTDKKAPLIVPGVAGRLYRVRMWMRANMEGTWFGDPYSGGPDDPHTPATSRAANVTNRYLTTPARRRTVGVPVGIDFPGQINAPRTGDCVHLSRLRLSFSPIREMYSCNQNNGLHIKASNPFRMWVLNGALSAGGTNSAAAPPNDLWEEQYPFTESDYDNWPRTAVKPQSLYIDIPCRAGSEFLIHYDAGLSNPARGYASIRTDDYFLGKDDPAFPYAYSFRAGGAIQWDLQGWWPMDENRSDTIDDEYGLPIHSVGPGGILTP